LKIAKYSKKDVPNWSPGHGASYIDLSDLEATAKCTSSTSTKKEKKMKTTSANNVRSLQSTGDTGGGEGGEETTTPSIPRDKTKASKASQQQSQTSQCPPSSFQLLMLQENSVKYWMDYWPQHQFCCTAQALDAGLCKGESLNSLIIPKDLPQATIQSFLLHSGETIKFAHDSNINHHDISESGMYVILMASCDPSSQPIYLNGAIDSLDPYGYLPADLFGDLPFYMLLAGCYTLLALYWMVVCTLYYDQIIPLQLWISCVLAMGMIETTAMYSHYERWNQDGTYSLDLMMTGLVFGVAKRTMSRVVVLLVSLGYGVVKPSLGDDMPKVVQLGSAYFVVSVIYVFLVNFPSKHKSAEDDDMDYLSLLVFLLAVIDTVFYIWIIQSINSLLASLAARQQGTKYLLYRNFRTILFLALFFAMIWGLYSTVIIFDYGNSQSSNNDSGSGSTSGDVAINTWQRMWTVDALWELTYFLVLSFIAHMWAPSANSQRYAYSAELSQLEDDEEYLGGGPGVGPMSVMGGLVSSGNSPRNGKGVEMTSMDAEYGGSLNDADDPFRPQGANDTAAAISKKD
jgi:hypothetical protein